MNLTQEQDNSRLFYEKYRPHKIEDMILLPRLLPLVQDIKLNIIMTGSPGIGKTTLARILCDTYDYLEINMSKDNGVDEVRSSIENFCRTMSMNENHDIKIVYLEEFDRATPNAQDALKAMIEQYEYRIRWIATCNSPDKLTDAIKSRFSVIDFRPSTKEEMKFIMNNQYNKIKSIIDLENIKIDKKDLVSIIKNNAPDLRKIFNQIQAIQLGIVNVETINKPNSELFDLLINKPIPTDNWDWLFANCPSEVELNNVFVSSGRDFIKHIKNNYSSEKIGNCITTWVKYDNTRKNSIDPFIHMLALMYEYQTILNK